MAQRGDAVYLPVFSEYSYEIRGAAECIYVEFILEAEAEEGRRRIEPICAAPTVIGGEGEGGALRSLFYEILSRFHTERLTAVGDLYRLISLLLRTLAPAEHTHLGRIAPAVEYIRKNFTERITGERLAALCGISTVYLRKLFSRITGQSPIGYLHTLRIAKAKKMLESDYRSLTEIALALGYADIYSFSKAFKSRTGLTPTAYAAQCRGDTVGAIHASPESAK